MQYRRAGVAGGTYFFTVVTRLRRRFLCERENVDGLERRFDQTRNVATAHRNNVERCGPPKRGRQAAGTCRAICQPSRAASDESGRSVSRGGTQRPLDHRNLFASSPSLTYSPSMLEFIETPIYTATVSDYLDDAEQAALQWFLAQHPEAGAVVRGSGGLRKIRWRRLGSGKSAGVRVIYYARTGAGQIWLIMIYAKSGRDTVPGHVLKEMKKELVDVEAE